MARELAEISLSNRYGGNLDDTFGSVLVSLADGTKYSFVATTFTHNQGIFVRRQDGDDLRTFPLEVLVGRFDKAAIEQVVRHLLVGGALAEQWQLPPPGYAQCIDQGHDFGPPEFVAGSPDLVYPPSQRDYVIDQVVKSCRRCGEVVETTYSAEDDPSGRHAEAAIAQARAEDEEPWPQLLADPEWRSWLRRMRYCAICGIDEKDLTTSMLLGKNEKGEAIVYCPEC